MKIDEFIDALNGVDQKYIEEAALEIQSDSMKKIIASRKRKAAQKRRIVTTCISAAACLLVILLVRNVGFFRMSSKNDSAEMSQSTTLTQMTGSEELELAMDNSMPEEAAEAEKEELITEDYAFAEEAADGVTGRFENAGEESDKSVLTNSEAQSDKYGEIQPDYIVWEDASFVEKMVFYYAEDKTLLLNGSEYRFTIFTLENGCDVRSLNSYEYEGMETVFAYQSLTDTRYAYYEKNGIYQVIRANNMQDTLFIEGVIELLKE